MRAPSFLRPWILALAGLGLLAPVPRALAEEREDRPRRGPERRHPSPRENTPRGRPDVRRPEPPPRVERPAVAPERRAPRAEPFRAPEARVGRDRNVPNGRPFSEGSRGFGWSGDRDRGRSRPDRSASGLPAPRPEASPSRPAFGSGTRDVRPPAAPERARVPETRRGSDRTGFVRPERPERGSDASREGARPDRGVFGTRERGLGDVRGTHGQRDSRDVRGTHDRGTHDARGTHPRGGTHDARAHRDREHRTSGWHGAFRVRPAAPALRRGIPYHRHSHYDHHGFRLSFSFSFGSYAGWQYYYPFHHYVSGCDYAFFYPDVVSYCYVPFGFICDAPPVYVTRYVYVREESVEPYDVVEGTDGVPPDEGAPVAEPEPAAGSPVAERYLRDGSDAFRDANYEEAARLFRLAALAAPGKAGPLFALGQALLALGSDEYAARVVRKALILEPALAEETGDIVGVFESADEFGRVLAVLEERARESGAASDARFLLAVERYFSGDPRSREDLAGLAGLLPADEAVRILRDAAAARFADAEDLPPIESPGAPR